MRSSFMQLWNSRKLSKDFVHLTQPKTRFENDGPNISRFTPGCKESQFYCLPFGQAVVIACTSPKKIFWRAGLITALLNLNAIKSFPRQLGKLRTEFTCLLAKSASPGFNGTPFSLHADTAYLLLTCYFSFTILDISWKSIPPGGGFHFWNQPYICWTY